MNVKKAVKKIAAVAFGAALVGSTVLGAANLNDYPSNMMTGGAFDGKIVVGLAAKPQDVIAAIDIATNLQAESVSESSVSVDGVAGTSYSVENGVALKKDNTALSPFVGGIFDHKLSLDEEDLAVLERGFLESEDFDFDTNYWQSLDFTPSTYQVKYSSTESDFNDKPTLYVDVNGADLWTYEIDFDSAVNVSKFESSETITMMGEEFFISPDQDSSDVLKLTKGADEATIAIGEEVTLSGHTITLLGGTETSINLRIDGVTKSTSEGETESVGGENFYIKDVFTQTIPEDSIVAVISVGSNELELDFTDGTLSLDGEEVDGYTVAPATVDTGDMDGFTVTFNPEDSALETEYILEGESIVDPVFEVEVSFEGLTQELADESKTEIEFSTSSADLRMSFVNAQGNEAEFNYLTAVDDDDASTDVLNHEDVILSGSVIEDDHYFFLNEVENNAADVTRLFMADDVSTSDGVGYVKLTDEMTGSTVELKNGKEVYDTGVYVVGTSNAFLNANTALAGDIAKDTVFLLDSALTEVTTFPAGTVGTQEFFVWESENGDMVAFEITAANTVNVHGETGIAGQDDFFGTNTINISTGASGTVPNAPPTGTLYSVTGLGAATNIVWTEGGARITLDDVSVAGAAAVTVEEDPSGDYVSQFSVAAPDNRDSFTVDIVADSDDEPTVDITATSGVTKGDYEVADDNDMEFGLSAYGTYYEIDTDDKNSLKMYYPLVEQNVIASVGKDVTVSTSGSVSAGEVTTQKVNPISVGVAISDEDAMSLIGEENLIVVGGPSVNTVAATLKENPSREEILAEYQKGVGLVELYDSENYAGLGDTLALLVGGFDWADTQRASRAVATRPEGFEGNAIEVHGTSTTISEVKSVVEE